MVREGASSHPQPSVQAYLDDLVVRYERPSFIADDPIAFPHAFDDPRDQEIIGLFAAILAWGRRKTIQNKLAELTERMDFKPHAFVRDFRFSRDAPSLAGFKHRTFQSDDAVALARSVQAVLHDYGSLESLFSTFLPCDAKHIGPAIQGFSDTLLGIVPETPARMRKHLARPSTGSACKRLAMYARWMVRPGPVDLGVWTSVSPAQLLLPLDVHTSRQARELGLLKRRQDDWKAVLELTQRCRTLCPSDPVRYDFALFGLGAYEDKEIPVAEEAVTATPVLGL